MKRSREELKGMLWLMEQRYKCVLLYCSMLSMCVCPMLRFHKCTTYQQEFLMQHVFLALRMQVVVACIAAQYKVNVYRNAVLQIAVETVNLGSMQGLLVVDPVDQAYWVFFTICTQLLSSLLHSVET